MNQPTFHCVICGDPISPERVTRKAVTCSEQHAKDLKNARRKLRDLSRCRLCNRPSTLEERKLFAAWRKEYNKSIGLKRGWKTGKKRGPKKVAESMDQFRGNPNSTPLQKHLGSITV